MLPAVCQLGGNEGRQPNAPGEGEGQVAGGLGVRGRQVDAEVVLEGRVPLPGTAARRGLGLPREHVRRGLVIALQWAYVALGRRERDTATQATPSQPTPRRGPVRNRADPGEPIVLGVVMTAKMTTTVRGEAAYETLNVSVGEDSHEVRFRGRWLVEPDPDLRTAADGFDAGAYFGVAQTAKGNIAVYVAHCNERWPAQLNAFKSLDQAELPADIDAVARAALGLWRDI